MLNDGIRTEGKPPPKVLTVDEVLAGITGLLCAMTLKIFENNKKYIDKKYIKHLTKIICSVK
jgi:hypothetical protein